MFSTSTKWSLNRSVLVVSFILTLALSVDAQVLQTERFEIPIYSWEQSYNSVSAGKNGLYLNRRIDSDRTDYIQLIKLDTAFNTEWSGFLNIEHNFDVVAKKSFGSSLYFLSQVREVRENDFALHIINHSDGSYKRHTIRSYIPFIPTEFQITDNAVLIGGYFNHVPLVLYYNYFAMKSKVLPGLFNESGELTQIKTHEDNTFDVLISARNVQRQKTIWIKTYDEQGNLLRNLALQTEPSRNLLFGRSVQSDQHKQIVAGVFGNRQKEFTRGIFITEIMPNGDHSTRYYNFVDMKNFFKYMRAKREQRVKSRIERKRVKGKKVRMSYRFMVHELIPYKDKFILLGEAFYPRYQSNNAGAFTYAPFTFQPPMAQSGRVFAGFQYTHAVVICFDHNGKMLWDNSFEINDVRSFNLEQFVKLDVQDDKIAMIYMYDNEIRSKIIKDDQVLDGKSSDQIKTLREFDVVKADRTDKGKLDYWYDDFMYATGVQDIVNQQPGSGRRKVFFINKLTVRK